MKKKFSRILDCFWNIQIFQKIDLEEIFSYASHVRFVEKKIDSTELKLMKKHNVKYVLETHEKSNCMWYVSVHYGQR